MIYCINFFIICYSIDYRIEVTRRKLKDEFLMKFYVDERMDKFIAPLEGLKSIFLTTCINSKYLPLILFY